MGQSKKISDKAFLQILRENAGLYSKTAKAIQRQYNIDFSRQAARARALEHPQELEDIREETIDLAEEGLFSLMQSEDERIKLRAIEMFLKNKGKNRGYSERLETDYDNVVTVVYKDMKIG